MARYFLDTSALVKHDHAELGTDAVDRIIGEAGAELLIARLTLVETISVFAINADFRGGAICLFRTHFLGWSGRFFHGFDGLRRLWLESPTSKLAPVPGPAAPRFFSRPSDVGLADTPCFPPSPARQASPTRGPNGSQDVPRGLITSRFGTQLRWLFPRTRAPVPATGSGEPLGTDAEPGPSLSDGVRGPSHPRGGCSVTRPPSCCVTRPRAWSRTSILNRFASLLAGG